MNKLKITTGKWTTEYRGGIISEDAGDPGDAICDAPEWAEMSMKRWPANATLICDAGNTYQQCGLLPSELLEQRDDLLEAIYHIRQYWNRDRNDEAMHDALWEIINTTDELLDSIEKQENENK